MEQHPIERVQIIDLADNLLKHTNYLRDNPSEKGPKYAEQLGARIDSYFYAIKNKKDLKIDAVEVVDRLYKQVGNIDRVDMYVHAYFKGILSVLFKAYEHHGVMVFFILDNSLRNDRFKLLVEFMSEVGFSVIYPHDVDLRTVTYSPTSEKFHTKTFEEVSKEVEIAAVQRRHILYLEKDDSVNYLNYVLYLAEGLQERYTCAIRNSSIYEPGSLRILEGSFGGILKMKEI